MRKQKVAACVVALALLLGTYNSPVYAENVREREMEYQEMSYEDELTQAVNNIDLGDLTAVTEDLILPQSYGIHVSIQWESSDENVIAADGSVHSPSAAEGDKTVTLTAKLKSTMVKDTKEKTFDITVKALTTEELLEKEAAMVRSYINYVLNDGYQLPDREEIGISSEISWSVQSGEAAIEDGILKKTSASAKRQQLVLQATLKGQDGTRTVDVENLVLLDEYAGYIMSFFGGNDDKKTVHLAYSYDGEHFYPLNNGETILMDSKKRLRYQELRDPFVMRKKDGSFAILATNGWNSTSICLWDSEDLISFTNERKSVLSVKGTVGLSGFHTWAPECNYDPVTDQYTVYWSDPKADNGYGKTFYNTSSDLMEFSEPGILFDAGGSIIDASIKKHKGYYYLVFNDAYGDNETGKGGKIIYMAKSASLEPGSFRRISGAISPAGTVSEGPFLFENFKDGSWYVMYDHYSLHKFGVAKTADLESDQWDYLGVSNYMPTENIRHGGVVPVTEEELTAIIKAYRKGEPTCAQVLTPDAVTVEAGTDKLALPKEVRVVLADGQRATRKVTWDVTGVDTEKSGAYTVKGRVALETVSGEAVTDAAIQVEITEKTAGNAWKIILGICGVAVVAGCVAGGYLKKKKTK